MADGGNPFEAVRVALSGPPPAGTIIEHIDVQCDGCEADPILGDRFKCSVCEDRDLCSTCMKALVTARVLRAQDASTRPADPKGGSTGMERTTPAGRESQEPAWRNKDVERAVPCLSPDHRFVRVQGPERAIRLLGGPKLRRLLPWYLETFPPSRASCADVAWIACDRDEHACQVDDDDKDGLNPLQDRVDRLLDEWEGIVDSRRPVTAERLKDLAARQGVVRAKWMLFPERGEVDACWRAVAEAVVEGRLGPTAKVSSVSPQKSTHVICVTLQSFLDSADCLRLQDVLTKIAGALENARMVLKPDLYSILGIYSHNEWGLKPSILVANCR